MAQNDNPNSPNVSGMVTDQRFLSLSPSDKRAALVGLTGDQRFNQISDADMTQFISNFHAAKPLSPQLQMNRVLNASPTQFEIERNKSFQPGFGGAVADFARGAIQSIPQIFQMAQSPQERMAMGQSPEQNPAYQAGQQASIEDQRRKAAGASAGYRVAAVAAGPLVNVPAVEHAADVGDTGAILGNTAPQAALIASDLLRTGAVKGGDVSPIAEQIARGRAVEQLTNAVNPVASEMPKMRSDFANNLDAIKEATAQTGPIIDRASLRNAVSEAANKAHDSFRSLMEPILDEQVAPPPGFNGALRDFGYKYGKYTTYRDMISRLSEINNTLYPKYAKGGVAAQAAIGAENAAQLVSEGNAIRSALYNGAGAKLGVPPEGIATLYQRSGALRDLADSVQYYTDESLHKQNAAAMQPIDLHTTLPGIAARAGSNVVNRVIGPKADRMIRGALR